MRIFLTGSQGTGKSTLNKFVFDQPGLRKELCLEKSFDSISKKFFTDSSIFKNLNSPEFYKAQVKILVYATNLYINEKNFISSRGFADSYAYLSHYVKETKDINGLILIDSIILMQELLNKEEGVYTLYIPVDFEIDNKNNELRSRSEEFQKEIDELIKRFLIITKTKYVVVKGSLEERKKIVYKTVTSNLFK